MNHLLKRGSNRFLAFMMAALLILSGLSPATVVFAASNRITKLEIKKLPNNSTIYVGEEFNFDPLILSCEKKGKTTGCVYFEVNKGNSAGAQSARWGYIKPVYAGSFQIRALAFASTSDMKAWLAARTKNGYVADEAATKKYVTASSDWTTIKVENKEGEEGLAVARWQWQLNKALSNKKVSQILFTTENKKTYTVRAGKFTTKTLTIDAPNADIVNNGVFKEIVIEQIKADTFSEFAKGNSFLVKAIRSSIKLLEGAEIKAVHIDPFVLTGAQMPSVKINAAVGSSIAEINLSGAAALNISGESRQAIPVLVSKSAGGTTLTSSTSLKADIQADTEFILNEGAKGTEINISEPSVNASLTGTEKEGIQLEVSEKAGGAQLNLNASGVNLIVKAAVDIRTGAQANNTKIEVVKTAELNITGEAANMQLVVGAEAAGTSILTETKLDIQANAETNIVAGKGAEGTIVKEAEGVSTTVKNETSEEIIKTDDSGSETTVDSGTEESGTDTQEPDSGSIGGGGTYVPPIVDPNVSAKSISVVLDGTDYTAAATVELEVGAEYDISGKTDDRATNKNVSFKLAADSALQSEVTVSGGKLKSVKAGTAKLEAYAAATPSVSFILTIVFKEPTVAVTGVTLNKDKLTLTVGGKETLQPTIAPENATDKSVTWESSDDTVATVEDGLVTAVAAGSATITVKTVDGEKTATCEVTVNAV